MWRAQAPSVAIAQFPGPVPKERPAWLLLAAVEERAWAIGASAAALPSAFRCGSLAPVCACCQRCFGEVVLAEEDYAGSRAVFYGLLSRFALLGRRFSRREIYKSRA